MPEPDKREVHEIAQCECCQADLRAVSIDTLRRLPGNRIAAGCTLVIVEGAFDILSIHQTADLVVAVGIGPALTGARDPHWIERINQAGRVLLAFDNDERGDVAGRWWQKKLGSKTQRLTPLRKDPNEMLIAGDDLRKWIEDSL